MQVKDYGGSCAVVTLPKEIMVYSGTEELRETLADLSEKGYQGIALDCSNLVMLDASGLNVLLAFQRRLKKAGSEMKIVNIESPFLKKFFDKIQLHKVISIKERMC